MRKHQLIPRFERRHTVCGYLTFFICAGLTFINNTYIIPWMAVFMLRNSSDCLVLGGRYSPGWRYTDVRIQ